MPFTPTLALFNLMLPRREIAGLALVCDRVAYHIFLYFVLPGNSLGRASELRRPVTIVSRPNRKAISRVLVICLIRCWFFVGRGNENVPLLYESQNEGKAA